MSDVNETGAIREKTNPGGNTVSSSLSKKTQNSFTAEASAGLALPQTSAQGSKAEAGGPGGSDLSKRMRPGETVVQALLFGCGALSILTTISLVVVLVTESSRFFLAPEVSIIEFFTGTTWQPRIGQFGVWPLLNATLMVTTIAMLVALPLGLFAAVYLSEYARPRVRALFKPILELLAGIPTVVFGYFALTFVTPLLRAILGRDLVQIYNTAAAGLVVGILVIPLVASMAEDALRAVPMALREAAFGLGATRIETVRNVVLPAAASGISAAFIVAVSRAIGETMIVAIAAGAGPNLTLNPLASAETITGHIARISGGDLSYDTIDYQSIFALALLLFAMTLSLNVLSRWVMRKFREVY